MIYSKALARVAIHQVLRRLHVNTQKFLTIRGADENVQAIGIDVQGQAGLWAWESNGTWTSVQTAFPLPPATTCAGVVSSIGADGNLQIIGLCGNNLWKLTSQNTSGVWTSDPPLPLDPANAYDDTAVGKVSAQGLVVLGFSDGIVYDVARQTAIGWVTGSRLAISSSGLLITTVVAIVDPNDDSLQVLGLDNIGNAWLIGQLSNSATTDWVPSAMLQAGTFIGLWVCVGLSPAGTATSTAVIALGLTITGLVAFAYRDAADLSLSWQAWPGGPMSLWASSASQSIAAISSATAPVGSLCAGSVILFAILVRRARKLARYRFLAGKAQIQTG
jgi:hypothetical protein